MHFCSRIIAHIFEDGLIFVVIGRALLLPNLGRRGREGRISLILDFDRAPLFFGWLYFQNRAIIIKRFSLLSF